VAANPENAEARARSFFLIILVHAQLQQTILLLLCWNTDPVRWFILCHLPSTSCRHRTQVVIHYTRPSYVPCTAGQQFDSPYASYIFSTFLGKGYKT